MNIKPLGVAILAVFILSGCSKQTAPPLTVDEPGLIDQKPVETTGLELEAPAPVESEPGPVKEVIPPPETLTQTDTVAIVPKEPERAESKPEPEILEEPQVILTAEDIMPVTGPETTPVKPEPEEILAEAELDSRTRPSSGSEEDPMEFVTEQPVKELPVVPEPIFPDSAVEAYMIKRGDYLIKIAKNEYGDWRKWRAIYRWNREEIGENPNLIFPYHFLDLLKPFDQMKDCKLLFYSRTIESGESLWTIAREVYGDELAWIVLFWDNEVTIDANDGVLFPGTELKIREYIDPCNPTS